MSTFVIASKQDADRVLAYFNGFHDGFIKDMEIVSRQDLTPNGETICSSMFDVVLKIMHHSPSQEQVSANGLISCCFYDVSGIHMDFRGLSDVGWDIYNLDITETEGGLALVFCRTEYDGSEWQTYRHELFHFESAEFLEESAEGSLQNLQAQ